MPSEIAASSIVVGHWGDEACVSAAKDVVVPTITPIQHDLPRYQQRLQKAMQAASAQSWERKVRVRVRVRGRVRVRVRFRVS